MKLPPERSATALFSFLLNDSLIKISTHELLYGFHKYQGLKTKVSLRTAAGAGLEL
jgi:hypothetical protein